MIKCFLVTPTGDGVMYLRRYSAGPEVICTGPMRYHDAMNLAFEVPITTDKDGYWSHLQDYKISHEDPRWPQSCTCGYVFKETDTWQYFHDRIETDGITRWPHRQLPVGAMWWASWMPKNMYWDNKEDDNLMVITPGGEWCIDSRASNCTMKEDRLHRCWVRHGTPPDIHVDKGGQTCAAGAGSIQCGDYHGFLHHGSLTT